MEVPLRHGRSLMAGSQRHWGKIVGVLAVLAVAGATYAYWQYVTLHPSTDNAYVEANTVQISPSVSGEVGEVDVKSFDTIKAGDVLLKINQPRLEAQLKAAEAGLQAAQAKKANVEAAQAAVEQARAALDSRDAQVTRRWNCRQDQHPARLRGESGRAPLPHRRQLEMVG